MRAGQRRNEDGAFRRRTPGHRGHLGAGGHDGGAVEVARIDGWIHRFLSAGGGEGVGG